MADELEPEDVVTDEVVEPEPFILPEDFATQVQSWELGLDDLPKAVETYKRLQTEDGVIDAFISSGQSLGFGIKELNRLFEDDTPAAPAPAAAPAPQADLDPERLMTAAEVQDMLAAQAKQLDDFRTEQTQAQLQAKQQHVFDAMDTWFQGQGVDDINTRRQIASLGEKHVVGDAYDPRVALAALERGKAEFDAWIEDVAQKRLVKKAATAAAQPTPVGGGQTHGGGGQDDKPDYASLGAGALDAAKKRVRDRLRANGELS